MSIPDIILLLVFVLIIWAFFVPGLYFICIFAFKISNPSVVIRILYAFFFIALFLFSIFYAPLAIFIQFGSLFFYIAFAVVVLIIIGLLISIATVINKGGK